MDEANFSGRHRKWSTRTLSERREPISVLVVDDIPIAAEALALALASATRNTRFAFSGIEAVQQSTDWPPDVIVLDINMPEHDGFQTARVLRRLPKTRNAVLIAFTALSETDVCHKALVAGFDAYCQKGNSVPQLIQLIEGFVRVPTSTARPAANRVAAGGLTSRE